MLTPAVAERRDALLKGGSHAPDHARPEVDKIGRVIDDDGRRRPGAVSDRDAACRSRA